MTSPEVSTSPGGAHQKIWRLAGPIILSNITVPLLGAVDTAVVGQELEAGAGADPALAGAVGVGAVIFSFVFWGFGFLRMGTTGFAAQAYGRGDWNELRAVIGRATMVGLLMACIVIALQSPLLWAGLFFIDSSEAVRAHAADYYLIRIWSAPATLANFVLMGLFIGIQRTGLALLLQLLLNGTNIVLDFVFVLKFGWGVEGVAFATVVGEYLTAFTGVVIVLFTLSRQEGRWSGRAIADPTKLAAMLKISFDIFVRTICLVAAFYAFIAIGEDFGPVILAANVILIQFQQFQAYGLDGFAFATEALVGSAVGRGDKAEFVSVVKAATIWAFIVSILFSLIYWLLGTEIVALMHDDAEVRAAAERFLPWAIVSPLLSVWSFMLDGVFIGATRGRAMRNTMVVSVAVFAVAVWLSIGPLENHGLWLALMIFMLSRGITLAACYPSLLRSISASGAPLRMARD